MSYSFTLAWPMAESANRYYAVLILSRKTEMEDKMTRLCPMMWTALHLGLASAATFLLCTTDLLSGAAVFLIH
jgi:hypothetical protein